MNDFEQKNIFPEYNSRRQALPNATAVLVLGICSLVFCIAWGFGIIMAVIALVLAAKDRRLYRSFPDTYSEDSYRNLKSGEICALIGLIVSAIVLVFIIGALIFADGYMRLQ